MRLERNTLKRKLEYTMLFSLISTVVLGFLIGILYAKHIQDIELLKELILK